MKPRVDLDEDSLPHFNIVHCVSSQHNVMKRSVQRAYKPSSPTKVIHYLKVSSPNAKVLAVASTLLRQGTIPRTARTDILTVHQHHQGRSALQDLYSGLLRFSLLPSRSVGFLHPTPTPCSMALPSSIIPGGAPPPSVLVNCSC